MFAGHVGVALAASRLEPRLGLGRLVAASLLLDALLWAFILAGWESVVLPPSFAQTHQPEFRFPYSHGLLAALAWSALAGALAWRAPTVHGPDRWRPAAVVAAVVFSHWLLDAWVHRPELPLAGPASPKLGLALWDNLPVALAVEGVIVVAALLLYLPRCGLTRGRRVAVAGLTLLVLAFTVAGMTLAPAPPSGGAMAASSLATIVLVGVLYGVIGRGAGPRPSA